MRRGRLAIQFRRRAAPWARCAGYAQILWRSPRRRSEIPQNAWAYTRPPGARSAQNRIRYFLRGRFARRNRSRPEKLTYI